MSIIDPTTPQAHSESEEDVVKYVRFILGIAPEPKGVIVSLNKLKKILHTIESYKSCLSDKEEECRMLKSNAERIANAWNVEGNNPQYHRAMKDKLRKDWPTLFEALSQPKP